MRLSRTRGLCESNFASKMEIPPKGATTPTSLAIALLIAGIGLLTLRAEPRAADSTAPQLPAAAGSGPNVTADSALGQDDLLHNQRNLVDSGSLFNYLAYSGQGVATDSFGHVYLSDNGNDRILGWRNMSALMNGQGADLVLGQPDFLSSYCNQSEGGWVPTSTTLCYPAGLAVDNADNLYVADRGNNRVLEYNTPFNTCASFPCVGPAANLVFGQGSSGTSFGTNIAGLGATGLDDPLGVAVDGSGNVYIADMLNHRVLEYNDPLGSSPPNVTAGLVFGQGSSGTSFDTNTCADGEYGNPPPSAIGLCFPTGVAIDRPGNVYIADYNNSRVLEYDDPLGSSPPNVTADLVFGQGSSGTSFGTNSCANGEYGNPLPSAIGLCLPTGVAIDGSGNVYIADYIDSRVLEYNDALGSSPPNVTADLVFGQGSSGSDFTANSCTGPQPSATSLCYPEALIVDGAGDLWVADTTNNRLLEYTTPITTDVTADLVLGQSDFIHNRLNRTKAQGLDFGSVGEPALGMAVDPLDHVYVADYLNNRVLGWRNAGALVSGQPADLVVGQPDFNSYMVNQGTNSSPTAGTLSGPVGVGVDGAGDLYVADYGNNRVLEYTAPFSACSSYPCVGGPANIVFGIDATGKNFTTVGTCSAPSATDLCEPAEIAIDASGNVYISDQGFGRVLEYNNPLGSKPPNVTADLVFGIDSTGKNFTSRGGATISATSLDSPVGLVFDASGNLYVADSNFNRVLEYNDPLGSSPPNVTADLVLGVDSTGKNFTSLGICAANAISLCPPTELALDGSGNLYVADSGSNRVLEYNHPLGSNPPNVTPDLVFGQGSSGTNFTSGVCAEGVWDGPPVSATGLCNPAGVALDTEGNLYVVDVQNNRVVVYNQPLGGATSAPTSTPTPTPTATATATPTGTATPTATPSPTPIADAMLLVSPKTIRFPTQVVLGKHGATIRARRLVMRNPKNRRQNAAITIGSITSTDPQFQPSSDCNGQVLPPGGRCVVAVTFTPDSPGPHNGTISIPSNARNGVRAVMVKGRGR